jgi:type III secretory pathway component EscR
MGREVVMTIKPGFYLNRKTWEILTVDGKGPGENVDTCVKVPTFLALLLAPILGATLVLFLPFCGIALFIREGLLRVGLKKSSPVRA